MKTAVLFLVFILGLFSFSSCQNNEDHFTKINDLIWSSSIENLKSLNNFTLSYTEKNYDNVLKADFINKKWEMLTLNEHEFYTIDHDVAFIYALINDNWTRRQSSDQLFERYYDEQGLVDLSGCVYYPYMYAKLFINSFSNFSLNNKTDVYIANDIEVELEKTSSTFHYVEFKFTGEEITYFAYQETKDSFLYTFKLSFINTTIVELPKIS